MRIVLLAVVALASIRPAAAQIESREGIALQNQILELRRDLQQVGRAPPSNLGGYQPQQSGPALGGDLTPQLLDRVNQLEDEVRRLRGRLDEVDNARQRQGDDLTKQIGDLQFRLQGSGTSPSPGLSAGPGQILSPPPGTLGPGSGSAGPRVDPGGGPPIPPAAPSRRTPELALQEGNAALARRDYTTAEAAAREVLATGRGPRTTDAQFLLAQSLAGRRDFAQAAVAYDDAYQRNRTGRNATDSLLGLANALTAINEKRAACQTLDKLRAEFPSPRSDLREPIAGARQRAGCR